MDLFESLQDKALDKQLKQFESLTDEQQEQYLKILLARRGEFPISVEAQIFVNVIVMEPQSCYHQVVVPADILVSNFIDQLIEDLKLPENHSYLLFTCHRKTGHRSFIEPAKTLHDAGIEPGCEIVIVPDIPIRVVQ